MNKLNVLFLWHMHQPFYKNYLSGRYQLPWVRLHCLKGYYDMPSILGDFPGIRQTFNLTCSLLKQIDDYLKGEAEDYFLQISQKPAGQLERTEKEFLLQNFFMCNWDTMINPYSGYSKLLEKRGNFSSEPEKKIAIARFSTQEYLDLQVWFNLTWFGFYARKDLPQVAEMFCKDHNFNEKDKTVVLDAQLKIMARTIPLYREMMETGQIELSTTPFYHPILPLLYNTDIAERCMPNATLPRPRFNFPEDARAQIEKAVDYFEKVFERRPKGMWPSEGSVCPELVPLLQEAGLEWIATDEAILFNSMDGNPADALFKGYSHKFGQAEMKMVFRDHGLSDKIGFVYSRNRPRDAAKDLLNHLLAIRDHQNSPEAMVAIILDGENVWEYFVDGGEGFLNELYSRLEQEKSLAMTTVGNYLENHKTTPLPSLHSGSWINSDYGIWIGGEEENMAWNYLLRTRKDLVIATKMAGCSIPYSQNQKLRPDEKPLSGKLEKAWETFYAAEGSDWFWWYGDQFTIPNKDTFDSCFRNHLANVYSFLQKEVPAFLTVPIFRPESAATVLSPKGQVSPVLDGFDTNFFEWSQAGIFDPSTAGSTMHRATTKGLIQRLYFGTDTYNFSLRFDFSLSDKYTLQEMDYTFILYQIYPQEIKAVCNLKSNKIDLYNQQQGEWHLEKQLDSLAMENILELSIPLYLLQVEEHKEIRFIVSLNRNVSEIEKWPPDGFLSTPIFSSVPDSYYW